MAAPTLLRRLRRLRGEQRGAALIEFAFALPVLCLLFVGAYQLMDAISAYRKMTTTVRTLADLTTQSTSMTTASANQILAASQQVLTPYPTANAVMRITQVKISAAGIGTVDWSVAKSGSNYTTGYTKGSVVTLPTGLVVANTSLIYSEINYQYIPSIASTMIGQIPLKDTLYMSPRNSSSIPCSDCT